MTVQEQQANAKAFIEYWTNRGDEKSDTQQFWTNLLTSVFGITEPQAFIEFEKRVKLTHTSFIDAYIPSTKVLIEQKGADIDLRKGYKQSDGAVLTPFGQAKRYANEMPYSSRPRWVVVCNFQEFLVYDMENPNGEPYSILLKNLEKEYSRLSFLTDEGNIHLKREMELSIKAGELVGKIYDALLAQYKDATSTETLKSLNVLCVRLVFLLYAEDAGIFGVKNMFYDYMARFQARDFRRALIDLFQVLDTKKEDRDAYLDADLAQFPYVNGGLFSKNDIEIPQFTDELRQLILDKASEDFDWSEISPTIFGAVFESTLNPETRRSGGMHYTSIENIHKVIDPLFLNDLRDELEDVKAEPIAKTQLKRASEFQNKLASLKFLDPACGSGNFLTESYLSLRRLENEAILMQTKGQMQMGFEETNPIKVTIHQFYGIEINDFAVSTATTALWIAESQMLKETSKIIQFDLDMLPLKTYHNIKEGNALRESWTEWTVDEENPIVIAAQANVYPMSETPPTMVQEPVLKYSSIDLYSDEINLHTKRKEVETYHVDFNYIMGNPPFVGARLMNESQKQDMIDIFGKKWKNIGNMDYVSGWYYKATILMRDNNIRTALVSTNSITQGEQVANLWKPLFENYGIQIDFAYRTFRWDSEASLKAHVHCVIVGFSACQSKQRTIYTESATPIQAQNINPYLIDAPIAWIESRNKPLCDVPEIGIGNKPIDGGNYLFTEEEMHEFIKKEPKAEQYFRKWIGADEFINRWFRYCLWLGDCTPGELRSMPECLKRVQAVRDFRLASKSEGTRKIADKPTRFHVENMPDGNYMLIPRVSSEKRRYVPIGYINDGVLSSDSVHITTNATLYHFGILTSNVHMAWMRVVCGRLEMRYRYSKDIVYNNFPWPTPTEEQKAKIEHTAQAILDVRAKYPESSLADLYDEVTMPPELRRAHQDNDRVVMAAYGFSTKMTESECVAELFKLYEELVK
ncbi:MAG: BREX-1 system adenine-specific DNA-methyltransferase PglX [Bacteroidales bacterium]|nr:BREX-1 system adenine-specific DNA-methyltransferase PglX [Bacteroidales bacterium]